MKRRQFLHWTAAGFCGVTLGAAFWRQVFAQQAVPGPSPYGPISDFPDANGLRLPAGFTSRVIATTGALVPNTLYPWHPLPDGGACFPIADGGWAYTSNTATTGALPPNALYPWHPLPDAGACFPIADGGWAYTSNSETPVAGGAGMVRLDGSANIVGAQRILAGTSVNCAGGPTPWGTWLSCEENGSSGRVYECDPQAAGQGVRRDALGSFQHEAAAVDPSTGDVYLTEDHTSGRLYRFVPTTPGSVAAGSLFAASVSGTAVTWVPVSASAPDRSATTTVFNGGEGAWIASGTLWFTTKGDGRVWELDLAS